MTARQNRMLCVLLFGPALAMGCLADERGFTPKDLGPPPAEPDVMPAEARLSRLTQAQYENGLKDLFGEEIVLPSALEPDVAIAGLVSVGATESTISSWGVEQYEAAAYAIAKQVTEDPVLFQRIAPCADAADTQTCARGIIVSLGRRAFRRPLDEGEVSRFLALHQDAASTLGGFRFGVEFVVAGLLQSPYFLYRVELGVPDATRARLRRFTAFELASRLSFFFWNTTPDDELLDAAESGALQTDEGLRQQVERLSASERSRLGVRNFFDQYFELYALARLSKDPKIFTPYSTSLGKSAKTETIQFLEYLLFDLDADYRDIMTFDQTFVDRRLAAIYQVRAPSLDGMGLVVLPERSERRGLLGQISVLGRYAHAVSTSPTLRGKFVREVLLCQPLPPPPSDLNTALPEPSGTAVTMRERLIEHQANPTCAACHRRMDPIGLALERFDGIGRYRTEESGVTIDVSGDLDGDRFEDARGLAEAIRRHPEFTQCLAKNLYRFAVGHVESQEEAQTIQWLSTLFERSGFRVRTLMTEIAMSEAFRRASETEGI